MRITARGFGKPRATWPTRATPIEPLGRSESLAESLESPRVAPSRSESLDRTASSDQSRLKRSPERPRDTIFDDFKSIWDRFSLFFEVTSRERLDSQREGPNPVSYWQAQYFQGFADFADRSKIDQN